MKQRWTSRQTRATTPGPSSAWPSSRAPASKKFGRAGGARGAACCLKISTNSGRSSKRSGGGSGGHGRVSFGQGRFGVDPARVGADLGRVGGGRDYTQTE